MVLRISIGIPARAAGAMHRGWSTFAPVGNTEHHAGWSGEVLLPNFGTVSPALEPFLDRTEKCGESGMVQGSGVCVPDLGFRVVR